MVLTNISTRNCRRNKVILIVIKFHERKTQLRRYRNRREDKMKMDLREVGYEELD
jgi:hypothetical protein